MKKHVYILILIFIAFSCEIENSKEYEDYREPYTGLFMFTTVKSTRVMCYDTVLPCIDGWKEINIDINTIIREVEKNDTNRIKIQFGDSIIGVDDRGDTMNQTIYPILSSNGDLTLPEYPIGGHNNFSGFYKGYDTIELNLQFGYGIGGYNKYKITGIRDY